MRSLAKAASQWVVGVLLGFILLELVLQIVPSLLVRGMAASAPLDLQLTQQEYTVRYSDADAFYWRPDLIRPLSETENRIEAEVNFATDEFGFRNPAPLAEHFDMVVLGRSTSLGAQAAQVWPSILAQISGWKVLNLSQPGGGIPAKEAYYDRFGRPHDPQWVIIEVIPHIDIQDPGAPPLLLQDLPVPLIQTVLRRLVGDQILPQSEHPIYPLSIRIPGRTVDVTCCLHYMDYFSLDPDQIRASRAWQRYSESVLAFSEALRADGVCSALLFAPTKENVYLSLAQEPEQLKPTLAGVSPLQLDHEGWLSRAPNQVLTVDELQANVLAGYQVVKMFASDHDLYFIDPLDPMLQSAMSGADPFMVYDSHWNALGHELIAKQTFEALRNASCP